MCQKYNKWNKKMCYQTRNRIWGLRKCLKISKTILRSQQGFRSEFHNVFTQKISKIPLSKIYDKGLHTTDWVISYPHGKCPGRVRKAEIMRQPKMKKIKIIIDFYEIIGENTQDYNQIKMKISANSWSTIQDTNSRGLWNRLCTVLHLIKPQRNIDKIYL